MELYCVFYNQYDHCVTFSGVSPMYFLIAVYAMKIMRDLYSHSKVKVNLSCKKLQIV